MKNIERIVSIDGHKVIVVVEAANGTFRLKKSLIKHDIEEGVDYEVTVDTTNGIFEDRLLATSEAKRLVNLKW